MRPFKNTQGEESSYLSMSAFAGILITVTSMVLTNDRVDGAGRFQFLRGLGDLEKI